MASYCTGQNPAKRFKMFNNITNIFPRNAPVNESEFERVIIWRFLQVTVGTTNSYYFQH